jgi:hypothetical protein
LDFRGGVGIHEFSRVARILEVVEQLGRVHVVQIVKPAPCNAVCPRADGFVKKNETGAPDSQ